MKCLNVHPQCHEQAVTRLGYCAFHGSPEGMLVHPCVVGTCANVSIDSSGKCWAHRYQGAALLPRDVVWREGMTLAEYRSARGDGT